MAGYGRPDVYINEQLLQSSPSYFPAVTPAAFVGYSRQGPTIPTLIESWSQFQRLYGGWTNTADDLLALQLYQYFVNGGRQAYVVRALGAGATTATLTLQDRQATPAPILVITADNPGAWGNAVFVEIVDTGVTGRFNLNIRLGTATSAPVERFSDLSMNPADVNNAVSVINSASAGSNYILVATPNNWTYASATGIPAASTVGSGGSALSGGADSTSPPTTGASGQYITALNLLSQGQPGQVGLLINLVGVTDSVTLNAALSYVAGRQDSFLIADMATGLTSAGAVTAKGSLTASSYGAVYWPNIVIGDPSSNTPGATRLISPAGSAMGQYAVTDAVRGAQKAPAGISTSLANVLATETPNPTPGDLDIVNIGHINAVRYFQNYGYCLWGSNTLKATQADSKIPVRRTLMAIEAAIKVATLFAVEENNDNTLWYELTETVRSILQQLFQLGGLFGSTPDQAFFVTCDASNNTPQTISAGEVHITVGVALQRPAEYIVINIGQFAGSTNILETVG